MTEKELEALFTEITGQDFPHDLPADEPFPERCVDHAHDLGTGPAPEEFFSFEDDQEFDVNRLAQAAGGLHEHSMRPWMRLIENYIQEPLSPSRNRDGTTSMVTVQGQKKKYPVLIGQTGIYTATERGNLPNVLFAPNFNERGRAQFESDYRVSKAAMDSLGVGFIFNIRQIKVHHIGGNPPPRQIFNQVRQGYGMPGLIGGIYFPMSDQLEVDSLWGWYLDRGTYRHALSHELGHRFHFGCQSVPTMENHNEPLNRHIKAMFLAGQSNPNLYCSPYSRTTYFEFFADAFSFYTQGRLGSKPELARWVKAVIDTFGGRCRFR